jgi:guanylate kinase
MKKMNERGKLFVISGPSGAGKSTVVFKATDGRADTCFSVSVTTRKPREGEVNGKEYFFVEPNDFKEMVARGELLEHAEYVANSYGTPKKYVEEKLSAGLNVVLDIEVQGAKQVKEQMPDAVMIFITPPSLKELENRLRGRGTDTERKIEARLFRAREEYREAVNYDYIIINGDADVAANEFGSILTAERCRSAERKKYLAEAF